MTSRGGWVSWIVGSFMIVSGITSGIGCGGGGDESATTTTETETGTFDEGTGLDGGQCDDVCGMPGCGECPSPAAVMVDGGGFMIDAVEVTNGAYAPLLEVEFEMTVLPPGCDFKSGFEPDGWSEDDLNPDFPVVGVDWCDAMVYCAWTGKELCGAVGGGASDWDVQDDAEGDAWYRACSEAGASAFPYGQTHDETACNGSASGQDALIVGGTLATCEGGVAGLYDMSGNVWEWSNTCESASGSATTQCRRRGGSRYSEGDNLRCAVNSTRPRGERDNAVGFRCCMP